MRALYLLLTGQLLSMFGSALSGFALPVYLYEINQSTMDYALARLLVFLPALLIMPLSGPMADRYDRRLIMLLGDSFAAFTSLYLIYVASVGEIQLWHIFLVISAGSIAGAFQGPASNSVMAQMIPREKMVRVSGILQTISGSINMITPILAAWLLVVVSLRGVLVIDLITFVVAVIFLLNIRIPRLPNHGQKKTGSFWADIKEALAFLKEFRSLKALMLLLFMLQFITAAITVLFAPLILGNFDVKAFGILASVQGGSMVVGGLAVGKWGKASHSISVLLVLLSIQCAALFCSGWTLSIVLLAVASFSFSATTPMTIAIIQSIWQRKVPARIQGRVFSLRSISATLGTLLGYMTAAPLSAYFFEPAMSEGGALESTFGALIGVGPARGTGLMFIALSFIMAIGILVAYLSPVLRNLEVLVKDVPLESAD